LFRQLEDRWWACEVELGNQSSEIHEMNKAREQAVEWSTEKSEVISEQANTIIQLQQQLRHLQQQLQQQQQQ